MKYCPDNCEYFSLDIMSDSNCLLGFVNPFRPPKTMQDINNYNWGYVMPSGCILRTKKLKETLKGGK